MPEYDALASVLERLRSARIDDQAEYDEICNKYANGGMYSLDDSSAEDYLEGKITAYDHAIQLLEGIHND